MDICRSAEIAKQLISFPSVTPDDAGALDYIKSLLESVGFKVVIKEFGPVRNLYAEHGSSGRNICFAGHIDVVDPINISLWDSDPFNAYEKAGLLYGRGATDMKGALASALDAAISFAQNYKDHAGKLSVLITSDEEVGRYEGTQAMLKWLYENGYKIDFAIIGEPTCEEKIGDIIKIGRRGSINFDLLLRGTAGHVAYPEKAQNPIPLAAKIICALSNLKLDNGNDYFDKSNLECTNIEIGNKTTNVIPAEVQMLFNVRFNNEHSAADIESTVYTAISEIYDDFMLNAEYASEAFLVDIVDFHNEFADIVEKYCEVKPKFATNGGTSDARFFKDYCSLLEFGVTNSSAHKINEFVKISDLQILKNVYYEAILKFCN
jgi:succinyl-diaminopimelate desuccinylase